jgi:hypothetical protein
MTEPIAEASQRVGWGWLASDDQTETLREHAEPETVGGEADWLVAVSVYVLGADLTVGGVTVPAGTYFRAVESKRDNCWQVDDADAAIAYAEAVEAAYLADRPPCEECGAEAGEDCRVPGCQGDWR